MGAALISPLPESIWRATGLPLFQKTLLSMVPVLGLKSRVRA